jgi:micrococcal nuclease
MKRYLKKIYYVIGPLLIFIILHAGLRGAAREALVSEVTTATEEEQSIVSDQITVPKVQTDKKRPPEETAYKVSRVVDGDTLKVMINGTEETVRVIGINTPETVDPRKPVECFGHEASDFGKGLLTGKNVTLTIDPTQDETDKYHRLLRYVTLPDGHDYGEVMIRSGYAYEYTYQIPYEKQSVYKSAQAEAQQEERGLWSSDTCSGNKNI